MDCPVCGSLTPPLPTWEAHSSYSDDGDAITPVPLYFRCACRAYCRRWCLHLWLATAERLLLATTRYLHACLPTTGHAAIRLPASRITLLFGATARGKAACACHIYRVRAPLYCCRAALTMPFCRILYMRAPVPAAASRTDAPGLLARAPRGTAAAAYTARCLSRRKHMHLPPLRSATPTPLLLLPCLYTTRVGSDVRTTTLRLPLRARAGRTGRDESVCYAHALPHRTP